MQAVSTGNDLSRLEKVAHNRSGLWIGIVLSLVGLLVFVLIFNYLLPNLGANLEGAALITLGLVFCLIPAALWLTVFYRLNRLEPEPKQMVFNTFLVGALLTAALHNPILYRVFDTDEWLYNTWWSQLLGGILVVGFLEQFIVYATVRYLMFKNPEFDERVDGVIYAIAAGLGLATILNFEYVYSRGGVDLAIGSIRMVVNTLAYASFAGVLGYFLGQTRFEKAPVYYLPLGLTLAATLNGVFFFLLDRTLAGGLTANPWGDLLFASVLSVISLFIVFWFINRANEETLRLAHQQQPAPATFYTPAPGSGTVMPAPLTPPLTPPHTPPLAATTAPNPAPAPMPAAFPSEPAAPPTRSATPEDTPRAEDAPGNDKQEST